MQKSQISPQVVTTAIRRQENLDKIIDIQERSGKFTVDTDGFAHKTYTDVADVAEVVKETTFTPGRDLFINYLAFQSGLIDIKELINLDELQSQISSESGKR
jgi:hypothetical protein